MPETAAARIDERHSARFGVLGRNSRAPHSMRPVFPRWGGRGGGDGVGGGGVVHTFNVLDKGVLVWRYIF